jgi:hypothetical protein
MSALTEFLFPAPAKRTAGAIVGWWEKRRLAYNVGVGAAGLVSLVSVPLIVALPPFSNVFIPPWQAVVAFGLGANVCYFLGPLAEIAIEKVWGRQVLPTGPALYRMGLTFSMGLALFPTLLASIVWVVRIIAAVVA